MGQELHAILTEQAMSCYQAGVAVKHKVNLEEWVHPQPAAQVCTAGDKFLSVTAELITAAAVSVRVYGIRYL